MPSVTHGFSEQDFTSRFCPQVPARLPAFFDYSIHNEFHSPPILQEHAAQPLNNLNNGEIIFSQEQHENPTPLAASDNFRLYCVWCRKKFRRPGALSDHHNSHVGIKPHACPYCPASFAARSNLSRHKKTQHSGRSSETGLAHRGMMAESSTANTSPFQISEQGGTAIFIPSTAPHMASDARFS
ncbi:hypothetical protein BDV93DRAFT_547193 [Ceratobasidium sp. AG-I]|nr:hypothetical protein BDV93DRAFT_547193 [Ceratobasidium sp. AG-I]